jgi:hypothetical protein
MVHEYVPALQCPMMDKQRCADFFQLDANNLIDIGKLIAVDICLNNSDRFPITQFWPQQPKQGTQKNLMF